MTSSENTMLVIGVGQMRTGTTSLQKALEYLYDGRCYHMQEVMKNQGHVEMWHKCAVEGSLSAEMADKLFQGYSFTVDYPAALFYRDLVKIYPNAKFIMGTRDPESWLRSVRQTTLIKGYPNMVEHLAHCVTGYNRFLDMAGALVTMTFRRSEEDLLDDEVLKNCYMKYNEEVKEFFPEENLLVFEAKDGWEPLCKFLGKEIPDIPYPRLNSSDEFRTREKSKIKSFYTKHIVPIVIAITILWFFML